MAITPGPTRRLRSIESTSQTACALVLHLSCCWRWRQDAVMLFGWGGSTSSSTRMARAAWASSRRRTRSASRGRCRFLRKIAGNAELEAVFAWPLSRADQIRSQQQRQRGWKLYSFHAPEVECIGRGKASAPYEFGVKASIVTTNARAPGGQFVLHARTLPGNPYDGHTLGAVIEATERLTGREIERAYVDKGYRGHHAPNPRRVFISGQKRGVFGRIKRELRRRSAIEAVIGHMRAEGDLGP